MPTILYLAALKPAKWAKLTTRSSFLAYQTSLGISGSCKQLPNKKICDLQLLPTKIMLVGVECMGGMPL